MGRFGLLTFPVDIDSQPGRLGRPVVSDHHVVPSPPGQPLFGLDPNGAVRPTVTEMRRDDALVQYQVVAPSGLGVVQAGDHGHLIARLCEDPGAVGKFLVAIEICGVTQVDKSVAVELQPARVVAGGPARRAMNLATPVVIHRVGHFRTLTFVQGQVHQHVVGRLGELHLPVQLPLLPRGQACIGLLLVILERFFQSRDFPRVLLHLRRLRGLGRLDPRHRVSFPPVEASLGHRVEEGEKAVVLPLRDRIELVVVTTGAADRQAQEQHRGGLHPIGHILHAIFFRDGSPLEIDHVVAGKTGGDLLFERRAGEQVARQLLNDELVERQIVVDGLDQPIAPRPHVAMAVDAVAVRVGVAGRVEPLHGHPFAISRRGQQPIDESLVGARLLICQERPNFGDRRRQPGQVEAQATNQGAAIRFRCRLQPARFELGENETIDFVSHSLLMLHRGRRGPLRLEQRPVNLPRGPLVDPVRQEFDFSR